MSTVLFAAPAGATTTTTSWDFPTGLRVVVGDETEVGRLTVPDAAGTVCTADVETSNGSSVHPGHILNVYLNGGLLMSLDGIEDEPFKVSADSAGFVSSGADELVIFIEATMDRVSSSSGELTVTCEPPPPPPGGDGCTPGFWKQTQHFDSWVVYEPGDGFDVVFGVAYEVTLLEALQAGGGGEKALGRHAVAALLNAASPDVAYAFTQVEILTLVQDAWASGEFEAAKDTLEAENELGCPLD